MARHLLTDRVVAQAKPGEKPRLYDGDGLTLFIAKTGIKSWQLRYDNNTQTATLGKYPAMGLAEARVAAERARKVIDAGKHPTIEKRVARLVRKAAAGNTFSVVAGDWVRRESRRQKWSDDYKGEVEASLRNHLGSLMRLPLAQINAPIVAPILRKIEDRAPLMLEKVRPRLYAILDYGVETGAIPGNPLPQPRRGKKAERRHFPAVTSLPELGEILRQARAGDPCKGIQHAHALLVFTAQRVSEVVGATWDEIDITARTWSIPRARMKAHRNVERGAHVVPLPPALAAMLAEWWIADGSGATYVCPAPRDESRPITPEGVEKFYRNQLELGGRHSPHSWRSAFSTICRDAGKDGDTIEAQLDHVVGNKVAAAYDRARRLELRRELMQWYEEQLIAARDGAAVLPFKRSR